MCKCDGHHQRDRAGGRQNQSSIALLAYSPRREQATLGLLVISAGYSKGIFRSLQIQHNSDLIKYLQEANQISTLGGQSPKELGEYSWNEKLEMIREIIEYDKKK